MFKNKERQALKNLIAILLLLMAQPAAAMPTQEDLPGVPLRTVENSTQPREILLKPNFSKEAETRTSTKNATSQTKPQEEKKIPSAFPAEATATAVNMKPGINSIVSVSMNHPNRIITPFETPKVHTASNADMSIDESVIYVTPADNSAVTMFITEKDGDQSQALSLTLAPQPMPPREIRLLMDGFVTPHGGGYASPLAQEWEMNQEYTEMIEKTMRDLALGSIPQGYGLRKVSAGDPQVKCQIQGVEIIPGQVIEGHNVIGVVSRVTNRGSNAVEVQEASCYDQNVMAVAAWPTVRLAPGQSAELYVLFRRTQPEERAQKRPSLLTSEVR